MDVGVRVLCRVGLLVMCENLVKYDAILRVDSVIVCSFPPNCVCNSWFTSFFSKDFAGCVGAPSEFVAGYGCLCSSFWPGGGHEDGFDYFDLCYLVDD